jgi:hypothetical protein
MPYRFLKATLNRKIIVDRRWFLDEMGKLLESLYDAIMPYRSKQKT